LYVIHLNAVFFREVAEGIFDVFAVFNATSEYVLYYHSGRKTIRYGKKARQPKRSKEGYKSCRLYFSFSLVDCHVNI
jgi:hypothetical protein